MRREHMEILRRAESADLNEAISLGRSHHFGPAKPWSTLFKTAVADYGYWDEHLKEPCLLICARARPLDSFVEGDCQVAASSSSHVATFGAIGEADLGVPRKRAQPAGAEPGGKRPRGSPAPQPAHTVPPPPANNGQRHLTNRAGNTLCTAFNAGSCSGKGIQCPKKATHRHLCNICLGPHSAVGPPACRGTFRPTTHLSQAGKGRRVQKPAKK